MVHRLRGGGVGRQQALEEVDRCARSPIGEVLEHSESLGARRAAARVLFEAAPRGAAALPAIAGSLGARSAQDGELVLRLLHAVARYGLVARSACATTVEQFLRSGGDESLLDAAAVALARIGASDRLANLLVAADDRTIGAVLSGLQLLDSPESNPPNTDVVSRVGDVLTHGSEQARRQAATTLGVIGPRASDSGQMALSLLSSRLEGDSSASVRTFAARALADFSFNRTSSRRAELTLLAALQDSDSGVRRQAVISLGVIRDLGTETVRAIGQLQLTDESAEVRDAAEGVLRRQSGGR